jgi:hypothetical protein
VRVTGSTLLGRAVHSATGLERGDDGHEARATDEDPVLRAQADAIEADFPGLELSVRFGFFRADWRDLDPRVVRAHYTADDAAEMRRQLEAATRRAAS